MITVERLNVTYGGGGSAFHAVRDVSFNVGKGEFYTLLGPSGCGKTTTLRCVAGLERPQSGQIAVDGRTVYSSAAETWVPPHLRHIGMVFQSYAIWPHLNVFDNVAFPLRRGRPRVGRAEIHERVLRSLAMVKLEGLERRPATDLSGGQQQRLALARALVFEPSVLLLDEPLSNLDAKLRDEMRLELKQLTRRLNVTTLFVTHEQVEALTMSDKIAVMKSGRIVQEGSPLDIYQAPTDPFVADFVGKTNLIDGCVRSSKRDGGEFNVEVDSVAGPLSCRSSDPIEEGHAVIVALRPENLVEADLPRAGTNIFSGEIIESAFVGAAVEHTVRVGEKILKLQRHPANAFLVGTTVHLQAKSQDCRILPPKS